MEEKLLPILKQYEELNKRLENPAVFQDKSTYSELSKQMATLMPVVEKINEYLGLKKEVSELTELVRSGDKEMSELAGYELAEAGLALSEAENSLKSMLLPRDPNDDKNVIMEIRGGVGGEEGMLFAYDLFRMYSMYAESKGYGIEVANVNETELGGIKEICFIISGKGAYSKLKYEAGTHRVQRVPVTESGGRIHTSAATVAVLPEVEAVDFELDPKDLKIDTYRSSGAGGQHVNKTESAIRITHIPTGTVVECQDERSQYKNKDRAMQILRSKLYESEKAKQQSRIAGERKAQVGSGDRSERIRTYNFPQNRVTDHRLEGDTKNFNIDEVINGGLDKIIEALSLNEESERLSGDGIGMDKTV